ncbi:hypothetical protein evm_015377, partial [Chilo suppressalis]
VLHEAMSRCVAVLSDSTRPGDIGAAVCGHCARCFAVAAGFDECRRVCAEMPQLCADLVPLLRRPHLADTACAGAEAVAALAASETCRSLLARAGALHALLPAVLQYDYTLTESGVEAAPQANKQPINGMAVAALAASETCRSLLAHAGALHALLPAVLHYDYTLTESSVEAAPQADMQCGLVGANDCDAAETNGLTCLPKHGGARDSNFWSPIQ